MTPLVSVIVPVYNAENFIAETVRSVIDQSYKNWELWLVDDGSTDCSAQVIDSFVKTDARIKYIYKENGGQASARNLGIENSSGQYIAFLDSDDIWHPEKLEAQIGQMLSDPEIDLCYTAGRIFETSTADSVPYPKWIYGKNSGREWTVELFQRCGLINSSVIFKRELVADGTRLDEADEQRGTEDWALWLAFAVGGKTFFGLDRELVFYRDHLGGTHRQNVRMFRGKERVYLKYKDSDIFPDWIKKKQFRYTYRELMNFLKEENKKQEIPETFRKYREVDAHGFGSVLQSVCIGFLPVDAFLWVSNKIIYRIAYRLEKLSYFFKSAR